MAMLEWSPILLISYRGKIKFHAQLVSRLIFAVMSSSPKEDQRAEEAAWCRLRSLVPHAVDALLHMSPLQRELAVDNVVRAAVRVRGVTGAALDEWAAWTMSLWGMEGKREQPGRSVDVVVLDESCEEEDQHEALAGPRVHVTFVGEGEASSIVDLHSLYQFEETSSSAEVTPETQRRRCVTEDKQINDAITSVLTKVRVTKLDKRPERDPEESDEFARKRSKKNPKTLPQEDIMHAFIDQVLARSVIEDEDQHDVS